MLMVNQLAGFGARRAVAGASAEVTAFLARTSGLDATHIAAYTALIDGLVADGIWAKLDVLRIYATQDSATALLNLVSSSYNGTAHGSPSFTADRGFTGVDASSTVYIDSNFNPATATTPNFVRDSAHISAWNITNTSSGGSGGIVIGLDDGPGKQTNIIPKYSDGSAYFRINGTAIGGVANATARGHYIANRSGANALQGYKDGSSILTNAGASVAVFNANIFELAEDLSGGGASFGGGFQVASISIGSSLSSTDATNFYNRLRTYMTVVGVP